jgi:hypothetical protein
MTAAFVATINVQTSIAQSVAISAVSSIGVLSITGTANQIIASAPSGAVTLTLPQAISPSSSPTFSHLTLSGITANSFLFSGTAGALTTTAAPTNGQLLIGSTGAAPVKAALTQGSGISVTNGAGTITVANTGVTSNVAGTGISVSSATGAVTIGNTGVLSVAGTTSQVIASGSTGAITLSLPQSIATTSTPTFAQGTITSTPVNASDIATKAYVDGLAQGLSIKQPVRVSPSTNILISNPGTAVFDGITAVAGDRMLLRGQTTTSQNGIWIFNSSSTPLTRPTDFNGTIDGTPTTNWAGSSVFVNDGTVFKDQTYALTTNNPITIDTTGIAWSQVSGPSLYTAGTGITITGTVVSINAAYVGQASITTLGTITSGVWNGTGIDLTSAVLNVLPSTKGGTGVANASTITLGGNIVTAGALTTSGANALTLTTIGATNVTLPTSGTLVSTTTTSLPSIATVGTITTGIWNGTSVDATHGGTGLSAYVTGDLIIASATNVLTTLHIGSTSQLLSVVGGVPTWSTPSGSATLANPTALIGLTVKPGTLTSVLRSDAANALDQSISPTWTGNHSFSNGITATGAVTIAAPSSVQALTVTGAAGSFAGVFIANNTSGSSFGLAVQGGTTSADVAFKVANAAGTKNYLQVVGDGSFVIGNSGSINVITGSAVGNVTIAAPTGGNALTVAAASGTNAIVVTGAASDAARIALTDGNTGHEQYQIRVGAVATGTFDIFDATDILSRFQINTNGSVVIPSPSSGNTLTATNSLAGPAVASLVDSFSGSGSTELLSLSAANNTNGCNLTFTGNGATNPNKTIRVQGGTLQFLNSAYTTQIMVLTDTGGLTATSFTGAGTGLTGVAGSLTVGAAGNLSGGAAGELAYQTGAGTTTFSAVGTTGQVLLSGGTGAPTWSSTPTFTSAIVNGAALGTTVGSQTIYSQLQSADGNGDLLILSNTRTIAGTDWTGAGSRLQQKVDASFQGYIQFNNGSASASNNGGISFGTGNTTTSAVSILERMRIDGSGNVMIGTTAQSGSAILTVNGTIAATGAVTSAGLNLSTGNILGTSTGFAYTIAANPLATATAGGFISLYGSTASPAAQVTIGAGGNGTIVVTSTGAAITGTLSATSTCSASSFTGAATGLTGTASSLTAGTATTANALNTANNYQVNSLGVGTAANGTAGDITASRAGGGSGVIFFGTSGARYLFWDGSNYNLNLAPLIVGGAVTATGFTVSSDRDLKENIRPITDAADIIASLNGYRFDWKSSGKASVGLIAQEVETVLPELVETNANTGFKGVNYSALIGVLIEEIKALRSELNALKAFNITADINLGLAR